MLRDRESLRLNADTVSALKRKSTRSTLIACVVIVLSLLVTKFTLIANAITQDNNATATCVNAQDCRLLLLDGREVAKGYVGELKKAFKDNPTKLSEAREKYNNIIDKYNAWVKAAASVIEEGKDKNLKGETFKKQASAAATARREFTEYFKKELRPEKGATALLAPLVDAFIKIYKEVIIPKGENARKVRKERAESFKKDVTWPTWDEIPAIQ